MAQARHGLFRSQSRQHALLTWLAFVYQRALLEANGKPLAFRRGGGAYLGILGLEDKDKTFRAWAFLQPAAPRQLETGWKNGDIMSRARRFLSRGTTESLLAAEIPTWRGFP